MTAETEATQSDTPSVSTDGAAPTSGCCGGACCGGGGGSAADVEVGSVTAVYRVTGMTCEHCEGSISLELAELPGVTVVTADAATGSVTVVSRAPLDEQTVRSVLNDAGYGLVDQA
ncbi:heavy-metal-associated domain-containing protein [Streptomyces sp. NBC_00859]|uniref:heavy-metal-associated domain-containing protein n=1 Tax=Streptomyces sp. NBC_00859 TaxID=2903682 RepID=UPI00386E275D|nr:heavy-metal-associated domain-containing protein [Streptomyces sp. NBC_00859]